MLSVLIVTSVIVVPILARNACISQTCYDRNSNMNLNCLEHQFSGWSCKPCVDCDGTPCGEYWLNKTAAFPMYSFAKLGDSECDYGQAIAMSYDNSPQKHLNWNCEEFKFDMFVLLLWILMLCIEV